MAPEFRRYWASWHLFAVFDDWSPQSVVAWIEQQFAYEPADVRRVLVQVWCELGAMELRARKPPADPSPPMIQ